MAKCKCQDSDSVVCGKVMTQAELEQDGMCSRCADNVWAELTALKNKVYRWTHKREK
jgi:hypothetical protein